eukprot:TRINITY_DN11032_c0_g1_i3.p2 TRINITY_DN11032_c0_g1~~TRINITY_DN11032_c0_g1_i3.p2  ORF type:complete len:157 (-),score=52.15 TRINITY_DN11032_c0_g1_i3:365-835(-)
MKDQLDEKLRRYEEETTRIKAEGEVEEATIERRVAMELAQAQEQLPRAHEQAAEERALLEEAEAQIRALQELQGACWKLEDRSVCGGVIMGKAGFKGAGRCGGTCTMLEDVYKSEPILYETVLGEFESQFDRNGVLYHIGTGVGHGSTRTHTVQGM